MTKVTLNDLVNLQNEGTAVNTINNNSATIETAFDNTLSRDGSAPNGMSADIDMGMHEVINLGTPTTINSAARLQDVTSNPTILVPPTGTSGHTVPYLDGNNTFSGTNSFSSTVTHTAPIIGTSETLSGTLAVTGVATFSAIPVLPANSIANASLGTMAANTVKGSIAGGTPTDLSKTQLTTLLNPVTSSLQGALPATGGNSYTVYQTGAGGTQAWVTNNQVLLNTLTASSSATLTDITSFVTTFSVYEIVFENLLPATNLTTLNLQVHSASSYQNTSYVTNTCYFTTTTPIYVVPTTLIQLSGTSLVLNTGAGISGTMRVYNPTGTTAAKHWAGQMAHLTGASTMSSVNPAGVWNSAGAVDGFQVLFASGNIASGTIKIYGIV